MRQDEGGAHSLCIEGTRAAVLSPLRHDATRRAWTTRSTPRIVQNAGGMREPREGGGYSEVGLRGVVLIVADLRMKASGGLSLSLLLSPCVCVLPIPLQIFLPLCRMPFVWRRRSGRDEGLGQFVKFSVLRSARV